MKQYFDHIQSKEPHERRQHAMQLAGVITAVVFVVWLTTLGLRLGVDNAQVAGESAEQTSLSAAAAQSGYAGPNQLIVAPTQGY